MATTTLDNRGALQKRSLRLAGHRTSLALEAEFWAGLEKWARDERKTLPVLIAEIDADRLKHRPEASLASAVRVRIFTSGIRYAA